MHGDAYRKIYETKLVTRGWNPIRDPNMLGDSVGLRTIPSTMRTEHEK